MSGIFRFFSNWKAILGISLSLVGIYLAFRNFNASEFIAVIKGVELLPLFSAMIVIVFSVYVRAIRWKYLINEKYHPSLSSLFKATMVGYFGNNVFPLRLGELMRPYFLSRIEPVSAMNIFATVVVERFLDLVGGFFLVGMLLLLFPVTQLLNITAFVLIIFIGIFSILSYFFARRKEQIQKWIYKKTERWGTSLQEKIKKWLQSFYEGLEILWKARYYKRIILLTILLWIIYIANIWLIVTGFGHNLTLLSCLFILVVTTVAISVPSGPGYVGTYHAAAVYGFSFIGFSLAESQAMGIVLHAVGYIPMTLLGLYFFVKQHLTIEQVITE